MVFRTDRPRLFFRRYSAVSEAVPALFFDVCFLSAVTVAFLTLGCQQIPSSRPNLGAGIGEYSSGDGEATEQWRQAALDRTSGKEKRTAGANSPRSSRVSSDKPSSGETKRNAESGSKDPFQFVRRLFHSGSGTENESKAGKVGKSDVPRLPDTSSLFPADRYDKDLVESGASESTDVSRLTLGRTVPLSTGKRAPQSSFAEQRDTPEPISSGFAALDFAESPIRPVTGTVVSEGKTETVASYEAAESGANDGETAVHSSPYFSSRQKNPASERKSDHLTAAESLAKAATDDESLDSLIQQLSDFSPIERMPDSADYDWTLLLFADPVDIRADSDEALERPIKPSDSGIAPASFETSGEEGNHLCPVNSLSVDPSASLPRIEKDEMAKRLPSAVTKTETGKIELSPDIRALIDSSPFSFLNKAPAPSDPITEEIVAPAPMIATAATLRSETVEPIPSNLAEANRATRTTLLPNRESWRLEADRAITLLQEEIHRKAASGGITATEEARLRLLLLSTGNIPGAAEKIAGATPALQEFWEKQCRGLGSLLENGRISSGDNDALAAVAGELDRGLDSLKRECPLAVRKALFVEASAPFGLYREKTPRYRPGETVFIYLELDNVVSRDLRPGYEISVLCRWSGRDLNGNSAFPGAEQLCVSRSESSLQDIPLNLSIRLPEGLAPGDYRLQVALTDKNGSARGETTTDLTFRVW